MNIKNNNVYIADSKYKLEKDENNYIHIIDCNTEKEISITKEHNIDNIKELPKFYSEINYTNNIPNLNRSLVFQAVENNELKVFCNIDTNKYIDFTKDLHIKVNNNISVDIDHDFVIIKENKNFIPQKILQFFVNDKIVIKPKTINEIIHILGYKFNQVFDLKKEFLKKENCTDIEHNFGRLEVISLDKDNINLKMDNARLLLDFPKKYNVVDEKMYDKEIDYIYERSENRHYYSYTEDGYDVEKHDEFNVKNIDKKITITTEKNKLEEEVNNLMQNADIKQLKAIKEMFANQR